MVKLSELNKRNERIAIISTVVLFVVLFGLFYAIPEIIKRNAQEKAKAEGYAQMERVLPCK